MHVIVKILSCAAIWNTRLVASQLLCSSHITVYNISAW